MLATVMLCAATFLSVMKISSPRISPRRSKKQNPPGQLLAGRDSGAFRISCFSARCFPPRRDGDECSYPADYDNNSMLKAVIHSCFKMCSEWYRSRGPAASGKSGGQFSPSRRKRLTAKIAKKSREGRKEKR